jgi:phosphatidylglycerophosphatase A
MSATKGFQNTLAVLIATGLGSGKLRPAPGTWGSAAALFFILFLSNFPTWAVFSFWFLIFIVGCWAAGRMDEIHGSGDNPSIVIDEWLGMALTTAFFDKTWLTLALGFFLFRIFDIAKLYPVRNLDQWSKKLAAQKSTPMLRGFGVIVDDLVAALQAAFVLFLVEKFFFS